MPLGARLGDCKLNTLVVNWRPSWSIKFVWECFDANLEWSVLVRQDAGEGINRLRDFCVTLSRAYPHLWLFDCSEHQR